MDIAASAQKIIDEAHTRKPSAAAIYLAENVRHHQQLCKQIVERRVKPAGWTLAAHEELIHRLISAENNLRGRRAA